MPKQTETAVLIVSDLHIGKKTRSFNRRIAKTRLQQVAETIKRIHAHLEPTYHLSEFVIPILGDLVDGHGIYPTQTHHQDITDPIEQAAVAAEAFNPIIETALSIADKVRVVGVPGNHGRSGKYAIESANFDILSYALIESNWRGKVQFEYRSPLGEQPRDEADYLAWMRETEINGHKVILHHGHGVRVYAGIPLYSLWRRGVNWRSALPYRWEAVFHGHFHSFGAWQYNDWEMFCNGTAVTDDAWAFELFGYTGTPKWHFFGVSRKIMRTWSYDLHLANLKDVFPAGRKR